MVKHFDHCTIVVRDVERAKMFFGLLGFKQAMSVVIAGEPFASYMGVPGIEADHVTLVLENASPRTEIQLLRYRQPDPLPDPRTAPAADRHRSRPRGGARIRRRGRARRTSPRRYAEGPQLPLSAVTEGPAYSLP